MMRCNRTGSWVRDSPLQHGLKFGDLAVTPIVAHPVYQLLRYLYAGSGLVDMILVRSKTRHRQVESRLFKVGVGLIEVHGATLGDVQSFLKIVMRQVQLVLEPVERHTG
jgi:hypothetical protein